VTKTRQDLAWQELELGATLITPGNSDEYKTGDWRSMRPVVDNKKCIKCGTCYVFCPDAAIYETEEGFLRQTCSIVRAAGFAPMNALPML